LTVPNYNASCR